MKVCSIHTCIVYGFLELHPFRAVRVRASRHFLHTVRACSREITSGGIISSADRPSNLSMCVCASAWRAIGFEIIELSHERIETAGIRCEVTCGDGNGLFIVVVTRFSQTLM